MSHPIRFDPFKSLWLWSMLLIGLGGLPTLRLSTVGVSLALVFVTVCLGHSVGIHRGIIHRAYDTSPGARAFGAWLMVLTGLGGPVSWLRLHYVRDHWQNQAVAPAYFGYRHSMLRDFWWNLHCRCDDDTVPLPADATDPWLLFLERTWPLHVLGLALVLFPLVGPDGVAVCIGARTAATILGHWAIGYLAHTVGTQPHRLEGAEVSGTNLRLLGVVSFGEGFHNNHHAWPSSARMGMGPWELDAGWWVLRLFERVGLVWNLRSWDRNPELRRPNVVLLAQTDG